MLKENTNCCVHSTASHLTEHCGWPIQRITTKIVPHEFEILTSFHMDASKKTFFFRYPPNKPVVSEIIRTEQRQSEQNEQTLNGRGRVAKLQTIVSTLRSAVCSFLPPQTCLDFGTFRDLSTSCQMKLSRA